MSKVFTLRHGLISLLIILLLAAIYFISPLPKNLSQQPYSYVMTDQHGELMAATIAADDQWRFPAVTSLPEKYVTALLQFEDKRFLQHFGIDPYALARAMKLNLQQGRVVSGGSTITMQLARMVSGNRARSYWQKMQEALLAIKLELHLSKQQILNLYASMAPFGGNTVGISAANWRYFNSRLEQMTWAQAALLAVLPNNPASIHPGKNRQHLLAKRNALLAKLNDKAFINKLDYQLALLETLPIKPLPMPKFARHLLQTLKSENPDQYQFKTFVDIELQQHLVEILDSYNQTYEKNNIYNISVLVLDNQTQTTQAYVGNSTRSQKNEYSKSLDIIQRPRSSGSLLKPFLFAKMLEHGYLLPDSLIADIPSFYDGYSPKNYDRSYRGLIPAKLALSQSLNVPAVRMLQQYGINQFVDDLKQTGLTTLWRDAEDYGLSLILGGAETTLWEITNSYSRLMLSAGGQTQGLSAAKKFDGEKLTSSDYPIPRGAAWLTINALLEVNRPGVLANWKDFDSSQQVAWKTGTSYGWHDAWAVGSNGRYTVGVWAGNANGEEARQLTGTQTAAPIMFDVFSYLGGSELPSKPVLALKDYQVCVADSYLPSNDCPTKTVQAPIEADFSISSPYYQRVFIDKETGLRVHGLCQQVSKMTSKSYFVVPPLHARYFISSENNADTVPDWRSDCLARLPEANGELPFDLEYPAAGARVKIPIELSGKLGRLVLRAFHTEPQATLYWHLDDRALNPTQFIHEQEVVVNPGWHQVTLVDQHGYQMSRWFKAH